MTQRRFVDSPWAPAFLFAIFTLLIVFTIRRFSIWFDESYTLLLVGPNGYASIAHRTAVDGHPPLWYWILKPWLSVFGVNILASRAQAALFMLAGLGVWYRFAKTRFSRPIALAMLALAATNPQLLHYAVEGRMYGLSILLSGVTCTLVTGRWRGRWIAYWPLAVAMLYIHYFLAFVIAAQFAYLLLSRREQGVGVVWILVYGASIVAAFLPWLPFAARQTSTIVSNGFWIPPITPHTPLAYVQQVFLHHTDPELQDWLMFVGTGFVLLFGWLFVRATRFRGGSYTLLWCAQAVPWAILLLLSCKPFVPVFHDRYVVFLLPSLLILIGAALVALPARVRTGAFAAFLVGQLWGISYLERIGFNHKQWTMNAIAAQVRQPIGGEVPIVVATAQFQFFDAKATMPDRRVIDLRKDPPKYESSDAIFYDRPDWWMLSLDDVHAKHVWLIEDGGKGETPLPAGWFQLYTAKHGYARIRLIEHE
ncbi:MAG TPA: glycosyltransferase family 39 protein [Kofleriaceae bacterium]